MGIIYIINILSNKIKILFYKFKYIFLLNLFINNILKL